MNKYEEFNNNNNLLKDLNMTIVSYESERIKAQKRGDSEKNLFYERKRQELEEIRDKIAQNELLDEKSILIIKELYDEEKNQNEEFKKYLKQTIIDFFNEQKINHASFLLMNTKIPMKPNMSLAKC